MHSSAKNFVEFVKDILPDYFINKKVLDVSGSHINGTNKYLFEHCDYNANDFINTKNETFDTIISSEYFEHDPDINESFLKIYDMLKPGGLFLFTCASTGKDGTNVSDYYRNLTIFDINEILPLNSVFSTWDTYYENNAHDLYFYGIKKFKIYKNDFVVHEKNNQSVEDIFLKYSTDKNKNFHNYSRQYESILKPYRNSKINFLEIGVYKGESLKAFREIFKNGNMVGIDINPDCKQYLTNGVNIEIGNFTDPNFVNRININYNIILDDGSHRNDDVIKAFEIFFPLLEDGGLYIIEDTICYKHSGYINKKFPNHLEYFWQYTKFLNQWRNDSQEGIKDNCVDPFKILKKTNNVFEYSIDKIEFGCSYIAITKKIRKHWIP